MKRIFAAIFAMGLLLPAVIHAADVKQQANAKQDAVWMTDFAAAQALAKKENKPMLVDFTGSDWCGWCIKLDREVFTQPAFLDYAKKNLVLVKIDFPRNIPQTDAVKKQNRQLSAKYGIEGFPTILMMKADGKIIGRTGYQRGGAENYVKHLQGILK